MNPMKTRRRLSSIWAVLTALVLLSAVQPAALAEEGTSPYTAYAEAAKGIAADNPAPQDWNTAQADNSGSSHPDAWQRSSGRTGWFGESWYDVDGNGCDTRNDVLKRDLTEVSYKKGSDCVVASGNLKDPYTGKDISFKRGKDTSSAVQIDHLLPLGYVYAHGGWAWDADARLAIANDPGNLLAVDGPANGQKSDSGPTTSPKGQSSNGTWTTDGGKGWVPVNQPFICEYAASLTATARKHGLGMPDGDRQWLVSKLESCATSNAGMTKQITPLDEVTMESVKEQVSAAVAEAAQKAGKVEIETDPSKAAAGATNNVERTLGPWAQKAMDWMGKYPMATATIAGVVIALGTMGARGRR